MGSKIRHVALVIETSTAYGRGILGGISKNEIVNGPWSIFIEQRGETQPVPHWLESWDGDGVMMRANTRKVFQTIATLRLPVADTQQQFRAANVPAVVSDSTAVAQLATEHLLERRIQHFAFVGVERALWSKMRRDAFVGLLRRAGYPCHVYSPIARSRFLASWEGGQLDLAEWLNELPKPVGVFAAHVLRALYVLDACRRIGLAGDIVN